MVKSKKSKAHNATNVSFGVFIGRVIMFWNPSPEIILGIYSDPIGRVLVCLCG